jgi:xanthine/CO dehydrogenase XdhC/CoxF family maturation factor
MEANLHPLLPLFQRERAAGRAVALGVLVRTEGSTYRKPGALILISAQGEYAGLISGGCLEGDLREHARAVIASGASRIASYDTRGPDDLLWGLGLGCEGAMQILLLRVGPESGWQPLDYLEKALAARTPAAIGVVVESAGSDLPSGSVVLPVAAASPPAVLALASEDVQAALQHSAARGEAGWLEHASAQLFVFPMALPPRVLLLGAGPDATPVVEFAARLGWQVTLVDHRPAYAVADHFPGAERVLLLRAEEISTALDLNSFSAAVVMSHHLPTDLVYLRAISGSTIAYVGLLGPAKRRERLLAELDADAGPLRVRLHAPIGLPLGGRSPESVALSIVSQLHAFFYVQQAPDAPAAAAGGGHGVRVADKAF